MLAAELELKEAKTNDERMSAPSCTLPDIRLFRHPPVGEAAKTFPATETCRSPSCTSLNKG